MSIRMNPLTASKRRLLGLAIGSLFMGCAASAALAAEPTAATKPAAPVGILPTPDYSGDFWNRSTLTGDWGGLRADMARKGFTIDWNLTQVGQTVFSGGLDTGWEYGGRTNATFNLDTGKMGLWPGGLLTVETEGQFGKTVNQIGRASCRERV